MKVTNRVLGGIKGKDFRFSSSYMGKDTISTRETARDNEAIRSNLKKDAQEELSRQDAREPLIGVLTQLSADKMTIMTEDGIVPYQRVDPLKVKDPDGSKAPIYISLDGQPAVPALTMPEGKLKEIQTMKPARP